MAPQPHSPMVERRAPRPPRRRDDMARRIRETLLAFGGQAHRTQVIEHLAREFRLDPRNVPDDFKAAVIRGFEAVMDDDTQRAVFGFNLPFGPGSHRWAVKLADGACLDPSVLAIPPIPGRRTGRATANA